MQEIKFGEDLKLTFWTVTYWDHLNLPEPSGL